MPELARCQKMRAVGGEIGAFAVLLGILVATVLLVGAGERLRLPYPVLVLLLGVVLAVVPVLPNLHIAPELILPLFLPPLIFAAARRTSWRVLWRGRFGVVWLAVVLVLVTMAAVGWTAWLVLPGVSVAGAAALGALTAPPDPVAAEAVAGPIGLPRRLVTTLQNEGLCNDATALVAYGVAVRGITGGAPTVPVAVLTFLYEVAAAVLLGLGVGWLARKLLLLIAEPTARSGLTLVVPFAGYLAADGIGASGVLAVLTVGLFLGSSEDDDTGVADRLVGGAFWDTVELLVTGLAFGLIGFELHDAVRSTVDVGGLVWRGLVICLVVVGLRFGWMLLAGPLARRIRKDTDDVAQNWREDVVLAWGGMRGLPTMALALALPSETPGRALLLFVAFAVLAVTLVLPGLTLPLVVRVLGVGADAEAEHAAVRPLAIRAGKAALARLRELDVAEDLPAEVMEIARNRQQTLLATLGDDDGLPDDYQEQLAVRLESARKLRRIGDEMLAAARREVLAARSEPGVDPHAADTVLRRLDLKSAHKL